MSDRRAFLSTVTGALLISSGARRARPFALDAVIAQPTVFHAHPDGQSTLVRFIASDISAPAGRMRVYDDRNRLLGTAGMLPREGGLVGELWIPLTRPTRVRSELEVPGSRQPVRTTHRLEPQPQWTIHWLTIADPDALLSRLAATPVLLRGAAAATLIHAGVRANPVSAGALTPAATQLDVARMTLHAAEVARRIGVSVSDVGFVADAGEAARLERAAHRAGIMDVVQRGEAGDPALLGMATGDAAMTRRLHEWLATRTPLASATAVVVGADPDVAVLARTIVDDWNRRYAFPHFVIGAPAAGLREVLGPLSPPDTQPEDSTPAPASLARVRDLRAARRADHREEVFAPFVRALVPGATTLDAAAGRFALPVAGTLVFNPSPFGRSDVVDFPGGGLRVVTDVPGLGYAFVPESTGHTRVTTPVRAQDATARNDAYEVAIDTTTGGIAAVTDRATGSAVAGPAGFNIVADATLRSIRRERFADVGERLIVERATPRGDITTTIALYRGLPWIEVTNDARGEREREYAFDLTPPPSAVECEGPGGTEQQTAPAVRFSHFGWVAARSAAGTHFMATPDTGYAMLSPGGRLVAYAPAGAVRLRFAFRPFAIADEPWRFGWGMHPFAAVATRGTGPLDLPTFGRIFEIRDPGVAVIGVTRVGDETYLVYLQELLGVARTVPLSPGVLTFESAVLTDLAGGDRGIAGDAGRGTALVPVVPFGFTAVRLTGIRLAS